MIIPIFMPTGSRNNRQDPDCPHCGRRLKGWSEPSDITGKQLFVFVFVVIFVFFQILATGAGFIDAGFGRCERPFSKRWHYLAPLNPVACSVAKWMNNEEITYKGEPR